MKKLPPNTSSTHYDPLTPNAVEISPPNTCTLHPPTYFIPDRGGWERNNILRGLTSLGPGFSYCGVSIGGTGVLMAPSAQISKTIDKCEWVCVQKYIFYFAHGSSASDVRAEGCCGLETRLQGVRTASHSRVLPDLWSNCQFWRYWISRKIIG